MVARKSVSLSLVLRSSRLTQEVIGANWFLLRDEEVCHDVGHLPRQTQRPADDIIQAVGCLREGVWGQAASPLVPAQALCHMLDGHHGVVGALQQFHPHHPRRGRRRARPSTALAAEGCRNPVRDIRVIAPVMAPPASPPTNRSHGVKPPYREGACSPNCLVRRVRMERGECLRRNVEHDKHFGTL